MAKKRKKMVRQNAGPNKKRRKQPKKKARRY